MVITEKKEENFFLLIFKKLIKSTLILINNNYFLIIKKLLILVFRPIRFLKSLTKCLNIIIINPFYWKLPLKHLIGLKLLIEFKKVCIKGRIKFFLTGGTLLGSIRQGSFAGRPTDVDVGIICEEKKIKELIYKFKFLTKPAYIKKYIRGKKIKKVQFFYDYMLFDVNIFSKNKKNFWVNNFEYKFNKTTNKKNYLISFSLNDLKKLQKIKLYNEYFFIPNNSKNYLSKKFGKNWKTPDKKQFFWKQPNV